MEAFIIGSNKQFYNKQQKSINSNEWDKDWKLLGSEQQFFSFGQQPAIAMNGDSRFDVFWLKDMPFFIRIRINQIVHGRPHNQMK
jgi:hypothetical protein